MATVTEKHEFNVGGVGYASTRTFTASGQVLLNLSSGAELPLGLAGTLSTRTDDDTGVVTLTAGHGITTDDTVDIYFDDGVAYAGDVISAAATTITVDLLSGTELPTEDSAVVVGKRASHNVDFDGDNLVYFAARFGEGEGHAQAYTSAPASITAEHLESDSPLVYYDGAGLTNTFSGAVVASISMSSGSTSANSFDLVALHDSDG